MSVVDARLMPVSVGGSGGSDGGVAAQPTDAVAGGGAGLGSDGGERGVVDGVGAGEEAMGAEDAAVPRPARSPITPTKAEREAHATTHLPFRSWCPVCVQGRSCNPPHRRAPEYADGDRRLHEIHLDYAFFRREGSEDLIKLLVAKALPSRALRAWVVPNKGVADPDVVERVHRGITEMGIRSPCVFKCDNEPAIRALR